MREPRRKRAVLHSVRKARAVEPKTAGTALKLVISLMLVVPPSMAAAGENAKSTTARPSPFRVFGTWNALSTMATLVRQYENERQLHFIDFTPVASDQILELLSRHQCDVGLPLDSFMPKNGKRLACEFESFVIARYVVGVAVNAKNPTRAVTLQDLQKIFAAYPNDPRPVTSWREIGDSGNNARIEFYRPPVSSAVAWFFRQRVLQGCVFSDQWLEPSVRQRCEKKTDAEVIGEIIKQTNAIGFFLYHCESRLDKRIRILRIAKDKDSKAVSLSASTIADGSYPLVDTLTLYVHPDAPPSAFEFAKFATGSEAAKIVQQSGLWPEHDLEKGRGQQRLADVKNGKGTEIVVCDLAGYEDMLKDLSTEFVKAKATVQLKFQKGQGSEVRGQGKAEEAVEKLNKGAADLLLADGNRGEWRGESGEGKATVEKGTVPGTLQGEGQSPIPRSIELGRMAVGIIVHPENPLESLPMDEAKGIFCGEIKKWPAVRGAAAAMHVFGLKHTDPTTQLLKEKLGGQWSVASGQSRHSSPASRPLKYSTQPDNEKVILAVARDPAAIGFVDMSQLPPNEKSVKLVPVVEGTGVGVQGSGNPKSKSPSPKTEIPNPLERTLTLYVSPNASQVAKDFADFLTPEHCRETIAQYNLLPPLHAEEANRELAKAAPARERPQIDLTSSDEPLPLLLDDPDAPHDRGRAKLKRLAAKPKPVIPAPEQPAIHKVTADAQPVPETESESAPTKEHPGTPSLSDDEIVWLVGGIVGVVLLAIGVGWLRAPHRKKIRR